MQHDLKGFLQRWLFSTVAVLVAAKLVSGISYDRWSDLILATLILGVLNSFLRPLLLVLSLPLLILSLGLFTLVINAALLYFVNTLLPGFHVQSFGAALLGALVVSIVTMCLNGLAVLSKARVKMAGTPPQRTRVSRDDGQGRVIDI